MNTILIFLVCLLLLSWGCRDNPVTPAPSGELWPLKPGNVWLYFVSIPYLPSFRDTLRIEVTGTEIVTVEQKAYEAAKLSYSSYSQQPPDYQWLTWSGPEGIYGLGGIASSDTFVVKHLWFKYPAEVGEEWSVPRLYFSRDQKKFYIRDTLTYSLVAKDETLETPAGKFKCYVYQFSKRPEEDVAGVVDYKYYFMPGVGLVGYRAVWQDNGDLFESFHLWRYQLGSLRR